MRILALFGVVLLAGCGSAPAPQASDPTAQAWYGETVAQLAAIDRDASAAFENHKPDEAAALIEKGKPLMQKVLDVRQPTLGAAEAAADLDDLYGRMLLSNRHYEWAEFLFQKNRSRWKNWTPQTPETERRRKQAEAQIVECDRHIGE
ncbi:MAG TPA: hypothetical protein VGN17_25770 [Bryobacteraceae bacterium]